MVNIGYITLILALITSIYSITAYVFGQRQNRTTLLESARNGLIATFGLVSMAVIILLHALVTHNFQIEYVSAYTSLDMSLPYLISALWAGNDGSLLFWAWLLSLVGLVVVLQKRNRGAALVPYAAATIMFTEAFFLIVLIAVSNPFTELSYVPADGTGLNPMLENVGMIFHPPLLLAGYVGLTVPFAFAIAALLTKKLDAEWLLTIRRWMLLAWLLLGVGNLIGAWWAYVELGWGGYWAWDPVENAGLMPWLIATAFIHSAVMQRRRYRFKAWSMVLVILSFTLAIFGTFLTRSGIIASVHTYSESNLGPFFLAFLCITLFGSLGLMLYRRKWLKSDTGTDTMVSRESTFLLNNLLLVGATAVIFVGTMYPLISETLSGAKIELGASFFNQVANPIFITIIVLAGICTIIGWQRPSNRNLIRKLLWPAGVAVVSGVVLFVVGMGQWAAIVIFSLSSFILVAIAYQWLQEVITRRRTSGSDAVSSFFGLIGANRPRYGAYLVHIAIVIITVGITGSSLFNTETEATLMPGESATIKQYTLTYEDMEVEHVGDTKAILRTTLTVYDAGKLIGELTPEKCFHRSYPNPVSEVAIRSTLIEDLYVILMGWDFEIGAVSYTFMVNPMVSWIWIGGFVFLTGGLIAFWPDRRNPR
ncbi:MAG: heme lyase CcmF/NrfE family subunit [Dehalococcoidales bacterium]|nr:MAG: heme lyase CcmF/NrfE family subunit [Dehalococcoidales bacterium]